MESEIPPWMAALNEEEWQFIKRFLLASGSLKEMAAQYNVSYPTVRIRLDRLIEKVGMLDDPKLKSAFHRKVRGLVADGKLDYATARTLIRCHEETCKEERKNEK